ncbi:hypothetical protein EVAR_28129_1 [Eumeta japonica]|uniref:Uncharacterized protein n=1 Tax=Eumeta variegata TaxID=151549 RepID=A0A4C1VCB2_EUMVA|nr:hypothetical protein EVAR_28129_1 [Eumeta japonica]
MLFVIFLKPQAENYEELVNNLLVAYKDMGCNMSLKIHFTLAFGFFLKTWEPLAMNTVSGSINISNMESSSRRGVRTFFVRYCTTDGIIKEDFLAVITMKGQTRCCDFMNALKEFVEKYCEPLRMLSRGYTVDALTFPNQTLSIFAE